MRKINFQNNVTEASAETMNDFQSNIDETLIAIQSEKPTNDEKMWIKKSRNLLNTNILYINAYLNSNGVPVSNNDHKVTDYVYVGYLEKITVDGVVTGSAHCFYDENKNFISSFSNNGTVDVPTNARYVRCTFQDISTFKLFYEVDEPYYSTDKFVNRGNGFELCNEIYAGSSVPNSGEKLWIKTGNLLSNNIKNYEQGTIDASNGNLVNSSTRIRTKFFVQINGTKDYFIEVNDIKYSLFYVYGYNNNNQFISAIDIGGYKETNFNFNNSNVTKIKVTFFLDDGTITPGDINKIKPYLSLQDDKDIKMFFDRGNGEEILFEPLRRVNFKIINMIKDNSSKNFTIDWGATYLVVNIHPYYRSITLVTTHKASSGEFTNSDVIFTNNASGNPAITFNNDVMTVRTVNSARCYVIKLENLISYR